MEGQVDGPNVAECTFSSDDETSITHAVARTVADYRDIDPLSPEFSLYEDIDTEALDRLFERASTTLQTRFRAAGVVVDVRKDDDEVTVTVRSREQ